jgi:hypothetical protein
METSAPAVKANGLSTVVNTIAAPSEAFETIRVAPTWGWALIVAIVLLAIGTFLQGPAARHAGVAAAQHMMTTSSFFANLSPAQKQAAIARAGQPSPWPYLGQIIALFVIAFFNTLFTLIGNAIGKGQADFKRLWAGSMNIAVPTFALGSIVVGIITMLRGPDAFNSSADIARAMPSLAYLMPNGSPGLVAFLSGISIFSLWGMFLNATMLRVTGRTSSGVAWTIAVAILLLGAAVAAGLFGAAHNAGFV